MTLNEDTGIRADRDVSDATNLIHSWTTDGIGTLITPEDIATKKLSSELGPDQTWSDTMMINKVYEVRSALLDAIRFPYGRGAGKVGKRIGNPVCLNPNDGQANADCEWLFAIQLTNSTAGAMLSEYGIMRVLPDRPNRHGEKITLPMNGYYLNLTTANAVSLDGFVKGFKYQEDVVELMDTLAQATRTLRIATTRSNYQPESDEAQTTFRDRPPASVAY